MQLHLNEIIISIFFKTHFGQLHNFSALPMATTEAAPEELWIVIHCYRTRGFSFMYLSTEMEWINCNYVLREEIIKEWCKKCFRESNSRVHQISEIRFNFSGLVNQLEIAVCSHGFPTL